MTLKFKTPKERIALKGDSKQGLRGNTVKLKGKSGKQKKAVVAGDQGKKKKKQEGGEFKFLRLGKSTYPEDDDADSLPRRVARAARGEPDSDDERIPIPAPTMQRRAPPVESESESESDLDDLSSFSSGSSYASSVPRDKGFNILKNGRGKNPYGLDDDEAEEAEKQDILARLQTLRQRGVRLSKNFTARSTLTELRVEMGRIEHEQEVGRSVQRLRRWLLAFVSGTQYVTNSKYSPKFARGRLNGFSDYVLGSIEDYDPIFERMSEKYGGVIGIGSTGNPMGDLFILMITQVLMFVFMQHKPNTRPPSEDEIKKHHPDMLRKMAQEMAEEMRAKERSAELDEQQRRMREQQAYMDAFQQPVRAQFQQPQYYHKPEPQPQFASTPPFASAPQFAPEPPVPRRMPAPSFTFPESDASLVAYRPSSPRVMHINDEGVTDAPDMFEQDTIEKLHESTIPTTPWVVEQQDPEPPQVFEAPPLENSVSTRRGRPVKVNAIPKKIPSETPEEEGKRVIQIG